MNYADYPRPAPPQPGLPKGWQATEYMYSATSKSAGKTYIRFHSDEVKKRNVCGVRQAVQFDAEFRGWDVAAALREHERQVEETKLRDKMEKERLGHLKGAARDEASTKFQLTFGPLEASTIKMFPGWRIEVKFLPVSGQTHATYFDDTGKSFGTIKDIEAMLGARLLWDESRIVSMVNDARAKVLDQGVQSARSEFHAKRAVEGTDHLVVGDMTAARLSLPKKRKLGFQGYVLEPGAVDGTWRILPDDVFDDTSLDLEAITPKVEESGWSCEARAKGSRTFSGSIKFTLFSTAELLVEVQEQHHAATVAALYIGTWLAIA